MAGEIQRIPTRVLPPETFRISIQSERDHRLVRMIGNVSAATVETIVKITDELARVGGAISEVRQALERLGAWSKEPPRRLPRRR